MFKYSMWCLAFRFTINLYGPFPHMGHIPNLLEYPGGGGGGGGGGGDGVDSIRT